MREKKQKTFVLPMPFHAYSLCHAISTILHLDTMLSFAYYTILSHSMTDINDKTEKK